VVWVLVAVIGRFAFLCPIKMKIGLFLLLFVSMFLEAEMICSSHDSYKGERKNKLKHGQGILTCTNGDRYEGEFTNGAVTGRGTYYWSERSRYENRNSESGNYERYLGEFLDGKFHGAGTLFLTDGSLFIGSYSFGVRHGAGVSYSANGEGTTQDYVRGELIKESKVLELQDSQRRLENTNDDYRRKQKEFDAEFVEIGELGSDELVLEFSDDVWFEISDIQQNLLVGDLARSGDTRSYRGAAPFRIKLGYVPGVTIRFNGRNVDLEPYTKNNIAVFNLGKADGDREAVLTESQQNDLEQRAREKERLSMLIRDIQSLLIEHRYLSGSADGVAGPKTRRAIRAFQGDAELSIENLEDFSRILNDFERVVLKGNDLDCRNDQSNVDSWRLCFSVN